MEKRAWVLRCCVFLSLLLLVAGAALAGGKPSGQRVAAGFDNWQTLGSGATGYSFANQPLPADFFCVGSEPFRGTVEFEGVPLRTEPDGILGTTDTVVERMDEAVFNKEGVAVTRLRARALNLTATKLVTNRCGAWKVSATLAGTQPVTRLTFHRENQYGGTFDADLRLRVQVTFTNVKSGVTRNLVRTIAMPTVNSTPFALKAATSTTVVATCAEPVATATAVNVVNEVTLLDGFTVDRSDGAATKAARPNTLDLKAVAQADYAVTGCKCNSSGQCMPTYSWHQPDCVGHYDCELHFTTPPCRVWNFSICPQPVQDAAAAELQVLRDRGIVHDDPAVILQKQLRTPEEIRADQARELAAQIRAAQKQ